MCTRRLVIHSDEFSHDAFVTIDSHGKDLLYACARCLEYDVYLHSPPTIERFHWRAMSFSRGMPVRSVLAFTCINLGLEQSCFTEC